MINIRSITYNLPKNYYNFDSILEKINTNLQLWDRQPYFIRTKRVSLPIIDSKISVDILKDIEKKCNDCGIRWFVVPIDPWNKKSKFKPFKFAYKVLKEIDQAFVNIICIKNQKIDFDIINESINLIKLTSKISNNGKDNFRLGLSSNISPNCPFFPFAMSSGVFSFSIALELTQEINEIIQSNKKMGLTDLRAKILEEIVPQIQEIDKFACEFAVESGLEFAGFDFSLAPIIEDNGSVFTILNHLGINDFGKMGTMFATAYLTDILKYFASIFKHVGFLGVMYSLLEDQKLCSINNERGVTLEELTKLSTMCDVELIWFL